jgi:2-oxoglutarate dehydrogenase E2 component (dihydrolipoamide succinyltransferase)
MAIKIEVPELGESVLEATVSRWLKKEGDFVNVGEVLVELETDKVNLEVGAKGAGVLQKIEAAEGEDVKVGDVLGTIDEKAGEQRPEPAAVPAQQPEPQAKREEAPGRNDGQQEERQATPQVSPVAARLARDRNVDVGKIAGTGNEGRITKADVESYLQRQKRPKEARNNYRLRENAKHDLQLLLSLIARKNGRACRVVAAPSRSACWKPHRPPRC